MADREKHIAFLNAFMSVWEIHRTGEPSQRVIEAYWRVLEKCSSQGIQDAFSAALVTLKYFPKPAELVSIISKKSGAISIEARSQQQWREILAAVATRGLAKGPPEFADPVTRTLVSGQFAWARLCELKTEDLHWEEKRWCEAFNLAQEAAAGQLMIEAPDPVRALVENIGRT